MKGHLPLVHGNSSAHRRQISQMVNQLIPVVKSITLTPHSSTTTIIDERMGQDKTVLFIPTNASASSEQWYLSSKSNGSLVITHSSDSTARTFDYVILG